MCLKSTHNNHLRRKAWEIRLVMFPVPYNLQLLPQSLGVVPAYKRVDTCAAEFEAYTPYQYSSYDEENEASPSTKRKVLILGGGPNRIGQGIEFDYCCCHASFALQVCQHRVILLLEVVPSPVAA